MSHALLLESLDAGGLWSIARGLARAEAGYKKRLQACDLLRRNDLDGRGKLTDIGIVQSASPRAPVQLRFPAELAGRWMPGLFPEKK